MRLLLTLLVAVAVGSPLTAENLDPGGTDAQYAWGENVGWVNGEPQGDGGPGAEVGDFRLSGWMWGENIGWISLSCENTSSCGTAFYEIANDGSGVLSGLAWAENVGWIDFAPTISGAPPPGAGVVIDPSTGIFTGTAWGENIGWIQFAFADPPVQGSQMQTSWNCSPAPPVPAGSPDLTVELTGMDTELLWSALGGATGYDVVRGDLEDLRGTGGNYAAATTDCVERKTGDLMTLFSGAAPPPGEGEWFLVRAANCGGEGTYDSAGPGLAVPRDPGIGGSGADCD